ncbi:MAG: hypothetical protein P8Y62_11120 [candidate division WOR-3 bacterium]
MVKRVKEILNLLLTHTKHRFERVSSKHKYGKSILLFPVIGLLSLLWVIIRVGTKPSRLRYPCMRVAVPTATTFVAYIIAIFASIFSFHKAKEKLRKSRYSLGVIFVLIGIAGGAFLILHTNQYARAEVPVYKTRDVVANQPMGEAKGIYPGRVVWVHDPDATNENCDPDQSGHGWFLNENNDQNTIDYMLDTAVKVISGENSIADAWDAFFRFNNSNRGKGDIGYQAGEAIFIKVNRTSAWSIGSNFEPYNYGISETSPHLILSLLKHLASNSISFKTPGERSRSR